MLTQIPPYYHMHFGYHMQDTREISVRNVNLGPGYFKKILFDAPFSLDRKSLLIIYYHISMPTHIPP